MADSYFTVHAKNPEMEAFIQKIIDHAQSSNEFRDMVGIPRIGREPDYINGRWCIRCHNSLPDDWKDPCDVCGAQTVWPGGQALAGLRAEGEESSVPTYDGIVRSAHEKR